MYQPVFVISAGYFRASMYVCVHECGSNICMGIDDVYEQGNAIVSVHA